MGDLVGSSPCPGSYCLCGKMVSPSLQVKLFKLPAIKGIILIMRDRIKVGITDHRYLNEVQLTRRKTNTTNRNCITRHNTRSSNYYWIFIGNVECTLFLQTQILVRTACSLFRIIPKERYGRQKGIKLRTRIVDC